MPTRLSINPYYFYYLYVTLHKPKSEILAITNISVPTYNRYCQLCETLDFTISTDFLEKELMVAYKTESDPKIKLKLLDQMQKIWAQKHKVPQAETDEEELDLGAFAHAPATTD